MEDKELDKILNRLESIEQRMEHIESRLDNNKNHDSSVSYFSKSDEDSTRSISENLVDNLSINDIPDSNFSKDEGSNIIDFSSFAALKNPNNLVNHETTAELSQQLVDEMEKGIIDINGRRIAPVQNVSDNHRLGFTSAHLILLISCLSTVILIILGIFFISWS